MATATNIIIVIIVLLIIFIIDDRKKDPLSNYEQQKALAEQYAHGCKSFDELSERDRKIDLSYQTKGEFCMKAFFRDHPFGAPAQFLSLQKQKQYKTHLSSERCKQAEQILWQAYKQRYPKAPPVDFQKK